MMPKYVTREGWIEVIIDDTGDYAKFEERVNVLTKQFNLTFTEKLNDHEGTAYWDFKYKDCYLTIHHNHYLGVSLFAKELEKSSQQENEYAKEIGSLLFEKIGK